MIEPMIEPTFVILGILASVAIPRLAATREDAEISAAVANLRTLVSDASAYYVAKGDFNGATWNQITNVPLVNAAGNTAGTITATNAAAATPTNTGAYLKVGGKRCIGVQLTNKTGVNAPAHIKFTKVTSGVNGTVCAKVLTSDPLKPYFNAQGAATGTINIGSNTSVY